MPAFQTSPQNLIVPLLVAGRNQYLFGSYNGEQAPCRLQVTSVASASNVVTLGVVVLEGNIPVAGDKISVAATTTNSGSANVTGVALTTVTINATTGIGTVVYAANGSDQATAPDSGYATVPVMEKTEALTNQSTRAAAVQQNLGPENGRAVRFVFTFPSIPTTATVTAESSDFYDDTQFTTLGTVASVAGGVVTGGDALFEGVNGKFVRFKIASVTGGSSPTGIGKVLV